MHNVFRVPALEKHLHTINVRSVGDLCSLTEQEVHHLPIAQPKVATVRRAMEQFAAEHQLDTNASDGLLIFVKINCCLASRLPAERFCLTATFMYSDDHQSRGRYFVLDVSHSSAADQMITGVHQR
jgi:hypothetical protein